MKIEKKISNIEVRAPTKLESLRGSSNNPAWVFYKHDTTVLNIECIHAMDEEFWFENLVVILTHDDIHVLLDKFGFPAKCLDKRFPCIDDSMFFVDCDEAWLRKDHYWVKGKWV